MSDAGRATAPTLPGRLVEHARRHPERVAIRSKELGVWREVTWSGYREEVAAAALALRELGVGPGDHVAILSDNRPEWVYADLAAQALGARSVGVYQTNPPADVAYVLAHSRSRVLFAEDQEQVDKAVEIAADTPTVERVVVLDPRGTRGYDDPRLVTWEELLAVGRQRLVAEPEWFDAQVEALDPDAPSMIVYTSGTTGEPKGAMISSANALAIPDAIAPVLGAGPDEQILSYLPLCHVAEKIFSLFIPLTTGCAVHFGEAIETVQSDLREVSPTLFLGVPRIWEKMHASAVLKMQDSSWLKRTLFDYFAGVGRGIAAKRRAGQPLSVWDRVRWGLGDLLVYRALQERLGMRRCRLGAAPFGERCRPKILHDQGIHPTKHECICIGKSVLQHCCSAPPPIERIAGQWRQMNHADQTSRGGLRR